MEKMNLAQEFACFRAELAAERALQEEKEQKELKLAVISEVNRIVSSLRNKLQNRIDPWDGLGGCHFQIPCHIDNMVAEKLTAETGLQCFVQRDIMISFLTIHAP